MRFKFVTILVLIFIRLNFPEGCSIAAIIRKRYGDDVLKDVRHYEKLDKRCRKLSLDIDFIETCLRNDVIPTFVRFKLVNQNLRNSSTYRECQVNLLKEELQIKKCSLENNKIELGNLYDKLNSVISYLDFSHIYNVITSSNEKSIHSAKLVQNKKLDKLVAESKVLEQGKIIHNFSSHTLTAAQISLLSRGLNFAVAPKYLKFEDYLLPYELLFRDVTSSNEIEGNNKTFFKTKLKDICLSSLRSYNRGNHSYENISQAEYDALLELQSNTNIVIQKSDKSNNVVILDKETYVERIKTILSDQGKFLALGYSDKEALDELLAIKQRIKNQLLPLKEKNVLDDNIYSKILPVGSQPGKLYGLCKVHKEVVSGCPPFRPIISAIKTPTYHLAKFLLPILEPISKNDFVIKDSFSFVENIRKKIHHISRFHLIWSPYSRIFPSMKLLIFVLTNYTLERI